MKRPIITEKTLAVAQRGWYTFEIAKQAAKQEVAKHVARLYKVTVLEVRTMSMHGKTRRAGKAQRTIRKPDWKKAMIRLAKDQKIAAFEAVSQGEQK